MLRPAAAPYRICDSSFRPSEARARIQATPAARYLPFQQRRARTLRFRGNGGLAVRELVLRRRGFPWTLGGSRGGEVGEPTGFLLQC